MEHFLQSPLVSLCSLSPFKATIHFISITTHWPFPFHSLYQWSWIWLPLLTWRLRFVCVAACICSLCISLLSSRSLHGHTTYLSIYFVMHIEVVFLFLALRTKAVMKLVYRSLMDICFHIPWVLYKEFLGLRIDVCLTIISSCQTVFPGGPAVGRCHQ